jgi:hypothetical protein
VKLEVKDIVTFHDGFCFSLVKNLEGVAGFIQDFAGYSDVSSVAALAYFCVCAYEFAADDVWRYVHLVFFLPVVVSGFLGSVS